jgi:hypothetical protein
LPLQNQQDKDDLSPEIPFKQAADAQGTDQLIDGINPADKKLSGPEAADELSKQVADKDSQPGATGIDPAVKDSSK